ncbi:Uncharacterized protein PRO82_001171 [Candidatus Protochlamydia amoebophila]|uniref:HEAT repeat domain-containing protein n=1 Tax=Candidatus Protochlamydia amoebophila TaxID=362787 RepID=UPI001BC8E9AC|nr:HEAT repeat domain-containing protein [Candidatus Protochlamydia amoebophila]MBS4163865.1 Uncharacterized protein [Candidatus Protochlamydia amoebophila]
MLMLRSILLTFLVLYFLQIFGAEKEEIQRVVRRIEAHLHIQDTPSAYFEAKQAIASYPSSQSIHEVYIKATARSGYEKEMLCAWQNYFKQFPDQMENRELIEEMAWGVLSKAAQSHSLITRHLALLAAFFCKDTKGVEILFQGMQDSNYAIRAFAVKLSSHLHDDKLIKSVKELFRNEKIRLVKHEVIKAIGKMKILELKEELEFLISSEQSLSEEKALAIESLVALLNSLKREEVVRLIQSDRVGLRLVACQAIAHFQSQRDVDQLLILTNDYHPQVKMASYQAMGLLKSKEQNDSVIEAARKGIKDDHFKVALSAAWLLLLYHPNEAKDVFQCYLLSDKPEVRLTASAALALAGRTGIDLASQFLENHQDPYIRLNLACGLVKQRSCLKQAAQVIKQVLLSQKDKFCEIECGIFKSIAGCHYSRSEKITENPEMNNQLLRLELFNILSILKEPNIQNAIREFLSERNWGITGAAAALLLTDGDEESIEMVLELLKDPCTKVRIQAALVLSVWSHEEDPIYVLQEEYLNSDRETKAKILEGIGRIGSMKSIPFLIETLKEPSQTLRLIAAMALIQSLNN